MQPGLVAGLRIEGLWKERENEKKSDQRGRRRGGARQPRGDGHEHAADRRPEDEAETECGADQPHALGPVFRPGDIGNDRLRGRDVATGDTVDDARCKQHSQRAGNAEEHIADRRTDERDQEHRAPPEPVGEPTEDGREDELHDRERGHQEAEDHRRGSVLLGIERQNRDDDAETHQIDEHDQEDNADLRAVFFQIRHLQPRARTRGILHVRTHRTTESQRHRENTESIANTKTRRHKGFVADPMGRAED